MRNIHFVVFRIDSIAFGHIHRTVFNTIDNFLYDLPSFCAILIFDHNFCGASRCQRWINSVEGGGCHHEQWIHAEYQELAAKCVAQDENGRNDVIVIVNGCAADERCMPIDL